jgi:hypothetical protein
MGVDSFIRIDLVTGQFMNQDNEIAIALRIEAKFDDCTIEGGVDMVTDDAGQIDPVVAR